MNESFKKTAGIYAAIAVVLSALQIYLFRHLAPGPDAICYLEMADQFLKVGYPAALSGHWSPLYALYGAALKAVFGAGLPAENFISILGYAAWLLVACATALYFLKKVAGSSQAWIHYAMGLAVFLFFVVHKVYLRLPDGPVFVFGLLSLLGWCRYFECGKWTSAAVAGLFAGLAFWSRSSLLPWSLAVAVVAFFLSGQTLRKRVAAFSVFILCFGMVAGPQIICLSKEKGHFTFGGGKTPLSEVYGAVWANGVSAWPVRYAEGDVRVYQDSRPLNFPGFYEADKELEDATVPFHPMGLVRAVLRGFQSLFFGYWSSSFSMLWPLVWAIWPFFLFGIPNPLRGPRSLQSRTGWFLVSAGALGVGMHLISFCIAYYLPLYLFSGLTGLALLVLQQPASQKSVNRAFGLVSAGFVLVSFLTTLSFFRSAHQNNLKNEQRQIIQLTQALEALPKPESGLRKLAFSGHWIGLYAVRLSGSQVYADFSGVDAVKQASRLESASVILKQQGVAAILAPIEILGSETGPTWRRIGETSWCIKEL